MKKLIFSIVFILYMAFCFSVVNAASATLGGEIEKNIKRGTVITGKTANITVKSNEINHFKDSITVNIDGAEWTNYSDKGSIDTNVTYEKIDAQTIKLHINVTEEMAKSGYTIEVPLDCTITKVKSSMAAVIDFGFEDIGQRKVKFATGEVSRLTTKSVKIVSQNDRFKQENKNTYPIVYLRVTPDDAERTRDKIRITFEGFKLQQYNKSGRIACNRGRVAYYTKIGDNVLEIRFDSFPSIMKTSGYTLTIPATGVVTGIGDIKAIADFGVDNIEPAEVTFARTNNAELISVESENPDKPIDNSNIVSSVTIKDDSTINYLAGAKINIQLNQVFHFVTVPKVVGTGKFENKCTVIIDPNDNQKLIIGFKSAIPAGETGTITVLDPAIERSSNATGKFQTVEMSFKSTAWAGKNTLNTVVAKYEEGANANPPLQVKLSEIVSAKKYALIPSIVIDDNSKREYKAGTKILLDFDNGFKVFEQAKPPRIKGTGKFADNCKFVVENGRAYILIPNAIASDNTNGRITIGDLALERDSDKAFQDGLYMTLSVEGDEVSKTIIQVANYSSVYDKVPQTTTVKEGSTETTTAAKDKKSDGDVIKFIIGNKDYTVNGKKQQLLAEPYIKDGYTMLPMRAIANTVGISDDKISYEDGTAEFKISEKISLKVTVGESEYVLAGKSISASVPAEIVNGTMFLPMRDLANAVGISNDNISFDPEIKEITLKTK